MNSSTVGFDLVDISRFQDLLDSNNIAFFEKCFSEYERTYCRTFSDSAPHFAGVFSAKEAVSKALGVHRYPAYMIEIKHTKEGAPEAYYNGEKLAISVSVTHTDKTAGAIAVS